MRVISQTFMDFPYEHIVVFVDDNKVCCRPVNDMSGRYYLLGEYETNERAQEVFNIIHEDYEGLPLMEDGERLYNTPCFIMPEK